MTELVLSPSDRSLDEEEKHMAPNWAMELSASLAFIICILGFMGNMLTILALPYTRKLRNAATWFVLNLAATELLFCVTILPMSAAHLLHLKHTHEPLLDDQGCRFFVFLRYVIVQAELLSIAAIAINRCTLIAFPKKYPLIFSSRKTSFIIFAIWVISLVIMIFPLTGTFGSFAYNSHTQECDFTEQSRVARKVLLALGFLLPCLIVVVSYSYIFYKARESAKKIRSRMNNNGNSSDAPRPAAGLRNRDMRIARTIGAIFLSFIICCTPVSLAHFYGSQGQFPTLLLLLHPLYWLQYCLNIFIYVLMNKQYREAYIKYISIWCPSIKRMALEAEKYGDEETSASFYSKGSRIVKREGFFRKLSNSFKCSSKSDSTDLDSSYSSQKSQKYKHKKQICNDQFEESKKQNVTEETQSKNVVTDAEFEEKTRKVSFSTSPPKIIPHKQDFVTREILEQKDFDLIIPAE